VNLMGSHGHKAVALALLGAAVTVVDVSPGNATYARAVAAAAGVELEYVVADVLQLPPDLVRGEGLLVVRAVHQHTGTRGTCQLSCRRVAVPVSTPAHVVPRCICT
jgi:2-polyprenyl-3-methyl-5-hydroxy-6-metoxy-1,4-benzoquinol methylase